MNGNQLILLFSQLVSEHASSIPIFWGLGSEDALVKFKLSKDSSDLLTSSLGIPPSTSPGECKGLIFNVYQGMGHTTNQKERDDLREWIKKAIPEGEQPPSSRLEA